MKYTVELVTPPGTEIPKGGIPLRAIRQGDFGVVVTSLDARHDGNIVQYTDATDDRDRTVFADLSAEGCAFYFKAEDDTHTTMIRPLAVGEAVLIMRIA